jgi:glutathione S-transferase
LRIQAFLATVRRNNEGDVKLYDDKNPAPNPRKVRIFLAEKGMEVERVRVAILKREHKAPEFVKKNSLGQLPVLELDDGTVIAESVAICRYLEALRPKPALFGETPLEQALIEMWIRRAEFRLWAPMGQVWINADPRTAVVNPNQFKDYGEHNKTIVGRNMKWLDGELGDGREFMAGPRYSMADIVLLSGLDFCSFIGLDIPRECEHLRAWHTRVSARPSASA